MRRLFLLTTGALVVLLLLEGVFHLLPVSTSTRTGYYIHPHILTYPARHCFTISTGWDLQNAQNHCANNLGCIANRDFAYNPEAIALIGDSFVEANMLPVDKALAAQLESKLGGKAVFAFGGPGSNLLDYAERVQFAATELGVKTFVIVLNRTDIRESLCGSGNIHAHCIDAKTLSPKLDTQAPPSHTKQIFRESALAQYVISQLKLSLSDILNSIWPSIPSVQTIKTSTRPSPAASKLAIKTFFSRLPFNDGIKYYFLIDPDRLHLFDQGHDAPDIEEFKTQAHMYRAILIDPTPEFQEFVRSSGMVLEMSPSDKHWNTAGINLEATAIANSLKSKEY